MDLCNLYIKGIPLTMTSVDLFNVFKEYGRIISSKIMEEDEKDQQKRYGFVSYSNSIETAKALIEMSGKEMIVRFHEPKVPRQEHNMTQQLELLRGSSLAKHFYIRENNKKICLSREPTTTFTPSFSYGSVMPPPYIYYPQYWTDYQGATYMNLYTIPPPPQQPTNTQHSKTSIIQAIIKLMKLEKSIPTELESTLLHELYQLDHSELIICLNNTKYCYDKFHKILENTS